MPLGAFKAALMGTAGVSTADVVLLSSQTADESATISFTSGITSTYGEYIFKFYTIHPQTDSAEWTFQVNATDGADYNDSLITSTYFRASHTEADAVAFGYQTGADQAGGNAFQYLMENVANDPDNGVVGELHLFNPSSTTYAKQFYSRFQSMVTGDISVDSYIAGYIDDATAIDDIQFKFSTGNIDAGTIKMWGVK